MKHRNHQTPPNSASAEEDADRAPSVAGRFREGQNVLVIPACELDESQALPFFVSLLGMMEWQTCGLARRSVSEDINSPEAVKQGKLALAQLAADILVTVQETFSEPTDVDVLPRIKPEISTMTVGGAKNYPVLVLKPRDGDTIGTIYQIEPADLPRLQGELVEAFAIVGRQK